MADKLGLSIRVGHDPPGTRKWNKIEHPMVSDISINGRGRPLRTFETVLSLIGSTTNRGGLVVRGLEPAAVFRGELRFAGEPQHPGALQGLSEGDARAGPAVARIEELSVDGAKPQDGAAPLERAFGHAPNTSLRLSGAL